MTDSMGNAVSPIGGGSTRPTGGVTPTPSKRPMSRPAPRTLPPSKLPMKREVGRGFDGDGYDFMGRDVEDTFLMDY